MSWNPNSTDNCVQGLEWLPTRVVDRAVAGFGPQSYSWSVESSASETIDRLWTFSDQSVSNAYDVIDIYDADQLKPVPVLARSLGPSLDASYDNLRRTGAAYREYSAGLFRTENVNNFRLTNSSQINRTGGFKTLVDRGITEAAPFLSGTYNGTTDASILFPSSVPFSSRVAITDREFIGLPASPPEFANYPEFTSGFGLLATDYNSSFSRWAFHVDGLRAAVPTNHRVLSLTFTAVCQRIVDSVKIGTKGDQPYRVRPVLSWGPSGSSIRYIGQYSLMPNEPSEISYTWFRNPATGLAWTRDNLREFNQVEQSAAMVFQMSRPNDPEVFVSSAGAIYGVRATVRSVEDTRVAAAVRDQPRQFSGWNRWNVTKVGGGAWDTKASGKTYLFQQSLYEQESVDRFQEIKPRGLGVRALGGGTGFQNGVAERSPEFVGEVPSALGQALPFAPAAVLQRSSDVLSVDSQPYALVEDATRSNVLDGRTGQMYVAQSLTFDASAGEPNRVRVLVRSATDDVPSDPLDIRVADGSTTIAQAMVQPTDLTFPNVWQQFELTLTPLAPWPSGSTGFVVWCFSAARQVGWQVQVLYTGEFGDRYRKPSTPVSVVSFGGDTQTGLAGSEVEVVERVDSDACISLGVAPDAVDGFTGEMVTDGCGSGVELSWDLYDLTSCFPSGMLQVERRTTTGGWELIYVVESPDTVGTVTDVEAARNSVNQYRCRVVSSTGFSSDWSATVAVATTDECCGYTFSSNHAPDRSVWLDDIGSRSYRLLDSVTFYEFENRDGALPARSVSDRLDEFDLSLAVALRGAAQGTPDVDRMTDPPGRRLFDPLAELVGSKRNILTGELLRVPYVCVADSDGNRWFASVTTGAASRVESGGQYLMGVTVREVQRNAAPATVTPVVAPAPIPPDFPVIVEPEEPEVGS